MSLCGFGEAGDEVQHPVTDDASISSMELRPMLDYVSVQTWLDGLRQHWGGDPVADDPERLPILESFCRFASTDPDGIIKGTTMIKDGERRIRVKGREKYAALIDDFQASVEGSRFKKGKWGNTVRSFLIHNGVLLAQGMQGGE
jgi:hypothetical protein